VRIVLCDHHVVFAESLAYLLAGRGHEVVAVTHDLDALIEVLCRDQVDVCMLDVIFGAENALKRIADVRRAAPTTATVVLSGSVDPVLVARAQAAGVRGIADKRRPVAEIINMLSRVRAGESVLLTAPRPGNAGRNPANDAQRLARFLTRREREVLSVLVRGGDTTEVACSLGIAAATARCHIQSVLTKMGAHSRLEVATTAVRFGMVSPDTGDWLIPA
jgi:two-component system nitrate/nitrite response regulator NarL